MNEFSQEQLLEIENFAYCYMLREETAIITGVDLDSLIDQECAAGIAFLRGRLKRKAEFHNNLIQLSKQLSSPAMTIEHKIAQDTYLNDIRKR